MDDNGDPWFNGLDTARCFGYKRESETIRYLVDPDNRVMLRNINFDNTKYPGVIYPNSNYIITEGGLFQMIMRSKLEAAKKFYIWVTKTVLPSIRKYEYYSIEKKYTAEL